jgi:protein-S-isoprenylcysteine O-methyltransferase Ste14
VHWRRLPDLGPRGEGWFAAQVVLFVVISAAGAAGPAWGGVPRATGIVAGAFLICLGGLLAVRGVLDLRESLTPFPKPMDGARLVEEGAYRLVRHPIYGGLIIAAIGWSLVTASPVALLAAAVLAAFFDLKSRREELWLADRYAGYPAYRDKTRRLIPWVY